MADETGRTIRTAKGPPARIESLDQFRGYTVLGMFVVNFVGYFAVTPALLKHHNTYCSYADTIMPQFFFAVGFAARLAFVRRSASMPTAGIRRRFVRRCAGLFLLGAALYCGSSILEALTASSPPSVGALVPRLLRNDLFQALVHIAVTTLWMLPVLGAPARARILFATASAALHVALSHAFWHRWILMPDHGIDGGLLGFLTWTVPTVAGTVAHDVMARRGPRAAIPRLVAAGAALAILGYALSCLDRAAPPGARPGAGLGSFLAAPPFVAPDGPVGIWAMSQRAGAVSYLAFGAGLSLLLYAVFVALSDVGGIRSAFLRTFGRNALAGYVAHIVLDQLMKPFVPKDAAPWLVLASLAAFLSACYGILRILERRGMFIRM